jgi:hypothetical protein
MVSTGLEIGVVATATGLGFRHGIDWDHIAALTDITGTPERGPRSMLLATMYAFGHAVMVFALGVLAIVASAKVPSWLDQTMTRVVGLTLLALGIYVLVSLVSHGRNFRMRSRWMLLFAGANRAVRWAARRAPSGRVVVVTHDHEHDENHGHHHVRLSHHEHSHDHFEPHPTIDPQHQHTSVSAVATLKPHRHRHVHDHAGTLPSDPFPRYGGATAFGVGVLHGVGAETPTQVLLFLTAARAGGAVAGVTLLLCFIVGLVAANTVVAVAGVIGLLGASRNFPAYAAVSVFVAVFSLIAGALFVLGQDATLPPIFNG